MATQGEILPCPYEAALLRVEALISEHEAKATTLHDSLQTVAQKPEGIENNHSMLAVHVELVLETEHLEAANAVRLRIMTAKILEKQMKEKVNDHMDKVGPGSKILNNSSTRESVIATLAGDLGPRSAERVLKRVEKWMQQQGWRMRYRA